MENYPKFAVKILLLGLISFVNSCKEEKPSLPVLTTKSVSNVSQISAISGGDISSDGGDPITSRGVCWSTTQNPSVSNIKTTDGSGIGTFSSNITGLNANTFYYVRSYATNGAGTSYGNQVSFTTNPLNLPTVDITDVSSITFSSAISGGNVTTDGGGNVIARGVCWNTSISPTIANFKTIDGTGIGQFVSNLTELQPSTLYYIRAYATNSAGTRYSGQISFTTKPLNTVPTLTTEPITNYTSSTAIGGGNISYEGGASVTTRGICWSINPNPTIADNHTNDGIGVGSYLSNLIGLTANTTYYVRAFASNSYGTAYGDQKIFILIPPGEVVDIEGNVIKTVTIGTQVWMAENLKVTKYKDGSTIPLVNDATGWNALTTPGYCWYNNNEASYKNTYGALYNWYTVSTSKICPTGWHVPSDAEWTILTNYLGGTSIAGDRLRESGTTHWQSPNSGATNIGGFTALPGGDRGLDSHSSTVYWGIQESGWWWTSTVYSSSESYYRAMYNSNDDIQRYYNNIKFGFSIRCLKD